MRAAAALVLLLSSLIAALAQAPVTVIGATTPGHCVSWFSPTSIQDSGAACGGGGGSGTVTSFSAGTLSPLFTTSVANPTTTPALSFVLTNTVAQNFVFAGPTSGTGAPTFRALVAADIPGGGGTVGPGSGGTGLVNPAAHSLLQTQGASNMTLITAATAGRLLVDQGAGIDWAPKTITQDVSIAATGVATVSGSGGTPFGTAAFGSFAAPGPIGGTTPSTGAFTTLTTTDLTITGPITVKVRIGTTTPITISNTTDYLICVRLGTPGPATVNLPTAPNTGDTYLVKDCRGDDATNNISVCTTAGDPIDGTSSNITGSSCTGSINAAYVMKNSNASATPVFFDRAAFTWSGSGTIGWIVN